MKAKINLQAVAVQLASLNSLNKHPNNFLHLKKNGDKIDVFLDINGNVVAQIENKFGNLFNYRDEYIGIYYEDSQELEVFTSAALHQHTEYSILDGANRVKDLAKKIEYAGAITDHGVMFGVVDFYKKMHDLHKHPITGFEAYTEAFDGSSAKHHLVILCKNQKGYENALKLCTEAQTNMGGKFPQRPLVTYENLRKYHEGLVVLSACLAGEIPQAILENNEANLKSAMEFFVEVFRDDFYLEIQRHTSSAKIRDAVDKMNAELGKNLSVNEYKAEFLKLGKRDFKKAYSKTLMEEIQLWVQEESVNARIVELAKEYGVKLVATTDAHYLNPDDEEMHEALLCNQVKDVMTNPNRWTFAGTNYHVHTQNEMEKLFVDMPQALVNTLEVADKCQYKFVFGNYKLPNFEVPDGYNQMGYLTEIAWKGFHERFDGTPEENNKEYILQLEFELETIKKTGYAGYFLIVWDYIRWAKEQGIAVGPGRGSGAGSLVLYCLHITEVLDPLKFGLLFERFLNPDRVSMPDIDIDFEDSRREEVIQYCRDKYGTDCVSRIITFGRMAAKNSVIDMCRVLDYPIELGRKISKLIPNGPNVSLANTMKESIDFRNLYTSDADAKVVIDMAMKVEGLIKSTGVHACGAVITDKAISNYLPEIFVYNKDTGNTDAVAGYTMGEIEECGCLKMDFLGLRTESVINESLKDIEEYHGKSYGIYDIPINDVAVYEYLEGGHTAGAFQLESSGMTGVIVQMYQDLAKKMAEIKATVPLAQQEEEIQKLGDQCFERLCCAISLYRPGPMEEIPNYVNAMLDESKIKYDTPMLEPILKNTYGILVYQEQVMQTVKALAGFTSGQADIIRKAMGKKKVEILDEFKPYFIHGSGNAIDPHSGKPYNIDGCVANGIDEATATLIWDKMYEFAKYAFNKSHGAAYAVITAQTAWLAKYYPVIFMKANLNVYINNPDKLKYYLGHCIQTNIKILPPSINDSEERFTLNSDASAIRFGLMGVKDVGKISYKILTERNIRGKFLSMQDFLTRMLKYQKINSKALRALIYVGALDEFDGTRAAKIQFVEELLEITKDDKGIKFGYDTIFDLADEIGLVDVYKLKETPIPELEEFSKDQKLDLENEYSGFYITGHPLEDYQMVLKLEHVVSSMVFQDETTVGDYIGNKVKIAGVVAKLETKISKNGKRFATFTLKDMVGEMNCIAFESSLQKFGNLADGQRVIVEGRVDQNDFGVQIIANTICKLTMADVAIKEIFVTSSFVTPEADNQYKEARTLLKSVKNGNVSVYFLHRNAFKGNLPQVSLDLEVFNELQKIFGERNVSLKK